MSIKRQCELRYLRDADGNKLLGWQLYNKYNLVTIPLTPNTKKPYLPKWNLITKTVHPRYANENVAIVVNRSVTVLDIDTKDSGMAMWKKISSIFPPIETPMVKTVSGGLHLYFKHNPSLKSSIRLKFNGEVSPLGSHSSQGELALLRRVTKSRSLLQGVIGWDIKNNGLVVAPPSSINGVQYKWVSGKSILTPLAEMPDWLVKIIREGQRTK